MWRVPEGGLPGHFLQTPMQPGHVGGCSGSPSASEVAGRVGMGDLSKLRVPSHPHWACPGEKPSSDTAGGQPLSLTTGRGSAGPATKNWARLLSVPGPQHCWCYLRRSSGGKQMAAAVVEGALNSSSWSRNQGTKARCFLHTQMVHVML